MSDLTPSEKAEAARQGWGLYEVYDLTKKVWRMNIMPIEIKGQVSQALNAVVAQAQFRDPLSTKALRVMGAYNAGKKK
jgi:hypothetical protein